MSWIQNFFQRRKKAREEESSQYEIHKIGYERELLHTDMESGKELNARISYQYPKGKLNVPVVPEIPVVDKVKPKVRKTRTERQPDKVQYETTKVPSINKNKEGLIKESKPTPKRTRPFQPTEIPSPVYGFNRPQKTSDIVEHELSHFLEVDFEEKMVPVAAALESMLESESINVETFTSTPESSSEFQNIQEEMVPSEENTVLESDLSPIILTDDTEEKEIVYGKFDTIPANEEEISLASKNIENEEEQLSVQVDEPRPKRAHLPFNVMMLKQDRLKWEESKKRRTLDKEKAQIAQTQMVPAIEVESEKTEINPEPIKAESKIAEKAPEISKVELKEEAVKIPEQIQSVNLFEAKTGLYEFPSSDLLNPPVNEEPDTDWITYQQELLDQTLTNFNVGAKVVNVTQGPAVTRFEVQPEPGVKVNKITNLSDDIKLSLAARDIRIEAPIPGKHTIGIEVPNQKSRPVYINEIIQSPVFKDSSSPLTAVLGLDISGKPIVTDLKKMPHGLIAGATGSGKSVCINTILVSLLFKASPEDLKLLLIDPKMVELAPYNQIPHLVSPVITDVKAATAALKWAVEEMERRYELFAHAGVRDINRFNELALKHKRYSEKLPFLVIVIDELADLMMMSPADVEEAICRIAQKARACGIHLIVATQRPSVDVITGLIKANIPTRIAFSVSSQVDSRTIIDISGAEKLLGRGDMLFLKNGSSKPVRLQGTFVSDEEIDLIVDHVRGQREPDYLFEQEELLKKTQITEDEDELFYEACEFIIEQGVASTSSLQRRFKIGYNRAARLMDMLETNGFITSANGSKPRDVLISESDLETIIEGGTIN